MKTINHTLLGLALLAACASVAAQTTGTLKKIADAKTIVLGYRAEAAPFSFTASDGQPAGYSVDLCKRVVTSLEQQLKSGPLAVRWVPVTSDNRVSQVTSGAVDLECGTTTVTLGRQEQVDFSSLTFVDGGSWVARADGPRKLKDLTNATVGVLRGSTTEPRLRDALKAANVASVTIIQMRDEADGVAALVDKRISAFANDRISLVGRVIKAQPQGTTFTLGEEDFSFEPYALMLRRDPAFRLAVNRALAETYRGDGIAQIYNRWFGAVGQPSALLLATYYLHAFGE
jgi:polar amino acid transport system substrate-binding protein/glutamate/aspartate transport system substrate-binding protein